MSSHRNASGVSPLGKAGDLHTLPPDSFETVRRNRLRVPCYEAGRAYGQRGGQLFRVVGSESPKGSYHTRECGGLVVPFWAGASISSMRMHILSIGELNLSELR